MFPEVTSPPVVRKLGWAPSWRNCPLTLDMRKVKSNTSPAASRASNAHAVPMVVIGSESRTSSTQSSVESETPAATRMMPVERPCAAARLGGFTFGLRMCTMYPPWQAT